MPPPLARLHQRLSKRSELLKHHLKHYHMSSAQFRRRTSELYLPESVYRLYDGVVKDREICQKTKPAPPRSRFSGVRAKDFGDVVFVDHYEIKHMNKKHQLFLVLDGATSLLWGATQEEGTEPVTRISSESGCMFILASRSGLWQIWLSSLLHGWLSGRHMESKRCQQTEQLHGQIVQRQRCDSLRGSVRSCSWMHLCILPSTRLLFVTSSESAAGHGTPHSRLAAMRPLSPQEEDQQITRIWN